MSAEMIFLDRVVRLMPGGPLALALMEYLVNWDYWHIEALGLALSVIWSRPVKRVQMRRTMQIVGTFLLQHKKYELGGLGGALMLSDGKTSSWRMKQQWEVLMPYVEGL